jgi:hypothetical protein
VHNLQALRVEVKFFERISPSATKLTGAFDLGLSGSAAAVSPQLAQDSGDEEQAAQFMASSVLHMCELSAQRVEVLQLGCQR